MFLKIPRFLSWVSDTMGFKFPKPIETVKQKVNELPCISVFRGQRELRGHSGTPHIIGLDHRHTSFLPRSRTSSLDRACASRVVPPCFRTLARSGFRLRLHPRAHDKLWGKPSSFLLASLRRIYTFGLSPDHILPPVYITVSGFSFSSQNTQIHTLPQPLPKDCCQL